MSELETKLPPIPENWVWTTIEEICYNPQYGWTTKAAPVGNLHLLRTTDISSGKIDWNSVPYCQDNPPDIEKYLLRDGDVVISRAGSVGYSYLIKRPEDSVFASYLIRFKPLIDEKYFSFYLDTPFYWKAISEESMGIAVQNVNASKLKRLHFPLPPLPEQHRIVAMIEELFTQLDAGVTALTTALAQLKRYRQSVLKAALEGRLTEEWREIHPDEEPVSFTIEKRIISPNTKNEEKITNNEIIRLPPKWKWYSLEQLSWDAGYGTSIKCHSEEDGYPVLRIPNISNGTIDLSDLKYAPKSEIVRNDQFVAAGDLLIIRTNGSKNLIGQSALVHGQLNKQCLFASYLIRYRLLNSEPLQKWIATIWNSPDIRNWMMQAAATTAGQYNISMSKLNNLPIPVPPIEEQKEIVAEIERRFTIIDEMEKTIQQSLTQAERLRQSILKRAFDGKLVPQDPHDEPASLLLERIKKEKATLKAAAKGQKKTKRSGTSKTTQQELI